MRLDQLVLRNISQHRVGATLTTLNVALGALLVGVILLLRQATADAFLAPSRGYSLVVGAPGSELQLVLSTVFHRGRSPGLLDYDVFPELEKHTSTELAVPYAVGDAFHGFRVVGTTSAFFEPRFPYPSGATPESKLQAGRAFRYDAAALQAALSDLVPSRSESGTSDAGPPRDRDAPLAADEAVLGAGVAAALDIRIGDRIEPTHGIEGGTAHGDARLWEVVGILRPTGTPIDEIVLINLDSFFRIPDHRGGVIVETGKPGISAVMLFPKPGVHKALLLSQLVKRTQLSVADIDAEVHQLLRIVGNVDQVFFSVAVLVVIGSALSVAVAIYNTLASRRREIAILRILGAGRRTVFGLIVAESTLISAAGGVLGLGAGHAVVWLLGGVLERSAGFRPRAAVFLPEELLALGLVVAAGALTGLLPALKAYRADAASQLAPGV